MDDNFQKRKRILASTYSLVSEFFQNLLPEQLFRQSPEIFSEKGKVALATHRSHLLGSFNVNDQFGRPKFGRKKQGKMSWHIIWISSMILLQNSTNNKKMTKTKKKGLFDSKD